MKSTRATFLEEIEKFMARHGMNPTTFSILCRNDPAFVLRMKRGRNPHADTMDEVRRFMKEYRAPNKARPKSRPLAGAAA